MKLHTRYQLICTLKFLKEYDGLKTDTFRHLWKYFFFLRKKANNEYKSETDMAYTNNQL